jgi:hypothetical protein
MPSLPSNMSVFRLNRACDRWLGRVKVEAENHLGAAEAMEDLLIRRDGLNSEQVYPHYVFRQP